ncbi:hypothetical protein [Streptomyces sp. NPDC058457]|uniref:hypothetical protein n=1 Tax=Streptomyces sp. NPDC058457 TaxID=3346507 RepID=UPI0036612BD3
MGDLKADTKRIRECSRALQRIYDNFTSRTNPAEDFSAAELGDRRTVGAFDEFADNWKIHRKDRGSSTAVPPTGPAPSNTHSNWPTRR